DFFPPVHASLETLRNRPELSSPQPQPNTSNLLLYPPPPETSALPSSPPRNKRLKPYPIPLFQNKAGLHPVAWTATVFKETLRPTKMKIVRFGASGMIRACFLALLRHFEIVN